MAKYSCIDCQQKKLLFHSTNPSTKFFIPETGEFFSFDDTISLKTKENAAIVFQAINYSLFQGVDMLVVYEDSMGRLKIQQYCKPMEA